MRNSHGDDSRMSKWPEENGQPTPVTPTSAKPPGDYGLGQPLDMATSEQLGGRTVLECAVSLEHWHR